MLQPRTSASLEHPFLRQWFLFLTFSGHARWHAQKTAVVCGDRRLTWQEFNRRVNRVANALLRLGIHKGDKIGVLMPNSVEAAEVICGIVKAGGVVVPLSALVPGPGLVLQITDSNSRILFVGAPLDAAIGPHIAALAGLVDGRFIAIGFAADGWCSYEDLLGDAVETDPGVVLTYDDDFNIMYSSGTTGIPKGIVHSHFARQQFALALAVAFRINFGSLGILTTPLYSNGTWIVWLATLITGGTIRRSRPSTAVPRTTLNIAWTPILDTRNKIAPICEPGR